MMRCGRMMALAAAVAGTVTGVARADFELPLSLKETVGLAGVKYVSNGVPLLPGMAMETRELHVLGPDGQEAPAQFRVLARYWRQDQSIRWVLVDFIGPVEALGEAEYRLVGRKTVTPVPQTALRVDEDATAIRVTTGAAHFEISKQQFNVLNRVQIDADLDGQYADSETVVYPDPRLGSVVTDAQGRKYYSSLGKTEFRVIDQGPVRVTVMAKGTHVSDAPGAFQPCLYGFEFYLTFHAGMPYVNVDAVLTNNFAAPIGEPHFKDWSILTRVGNAQSGGWGMDVFTTGFASVGGAAGESALLYQDSAGSTHWKEMSGFEGPGGRPRLSTFRGYRLLKVAADGVTRTEVEAGDFALGAAQCGRSNLGCVIAPKYSWQQYPVALQYGEGLLRFAPFPGEYSTLHWLEDGSARAHEFQLFFYIKGAKKQYTAMGGNQRPYAHVVYDNFRSQPMALPTPEFCGRAGALSDLGPYLTDQSVPHVDFPLAIWERRYLTNDDLKGNGFGWQVFGNRYEEMAGHSPWNYEPKCTSASLFNYVVTRQPNWLERGRRLSRQARDVRAYLIDDPDLLATWSQPGAYNRLSIMESFQRKQPAGEPHPYRRYVWPLPNHEHLNLDEVYDLYLLAGDERARRCMEVIAVHGACSTALRGYPLTVTRSTGWCLRSLLRYYELTGDKRFEPMVSQAIDKVWKDVDKAGTNGAGTWLLGIYGQGVILAYLVTGDERMRDLALGLADWARRYEIAAEGYPYQGAPNRWALTPVQRGARCSWANAYLLNVHAFAYHQTGDPEYLKAFEVADRHLAAERVPFATFLPTAMYYARTPRADSVVPAAITDLQATGGTGEATLTWTAPGDDRKTGRAAVYQVKFAQKPILEFVSWPDQKDTHVAFWGAENVADEPKPQTAGARETFTVRGLKPGAYYFAVKTRDEADNQAPISNVVEVTVK
jgi:hypothetical protein